VAGAVLLALYAVHAFSTESPAIDLRLLTNAPAASSFALCLVVSVVTFGVLFLVPVFMQTVQGHTALVAGLTLLPQGIVMGLGTVAGMKVVERGYVRWSCIGGSILLVATTAALLLLDRATPAWETAAILSARGLALGLIIQPLLQALMGRLPRAELPDANTLFNVIQRVGGSFGIALLGTFFQHRETVRVQAVLPRRDLVGQALVSGFHDTLWVLVALAGLALLLSLALRGTSRLE
jgi:predicted MFS family arabinose efflux permease